MSPMNLLVLLLFCCKYFFEGLRNEVQILYCIDYTNLIVGICVTVEL